jgi:hypothetical protein
MTRVGFLLVVALTVTGCGPQVDLKTSLQVADVLGGYYDAGVVDGRNKIVPSITFTLQKNTTASIHPLQLNVYFRQLPPRLARPTGRTSSFRTSTFTATKPNR